MSENILKNVSVRITADTSPFQSEMDKAARVAKQKTAEIKQSIQKEMTESKQSMALFGELTGVTIPRHLRGLVAAAPGIGTAFSAAFSTVAVFVFIDVLVKAGEKVKQLAEAYQESGKKAGEMSEAFSKVIKPIQDSNDSLEVQKDQIQKSIDKLEKKPHNAIKDAIDEAIVSADTLLSKLESSAQKISETLHKQSVSSGKGFIFGEDSNTGIATGWDNANRRLQEKVEEYKQKLQDAKGSGANEEAINDIRKEARSAISAVNAGYVDEFQNGKEEHIGYTSYNQARGMQDTYENNKKLGRNEPGYDYPGYDYSATLQQLGTVQAGWKGNVNEALGMFDLSDLKTRQGKDEAGKRSADGLQKYREEMYKLTMEGVKLENELTKSAGLSSELGKGDQLLLKQRSDAMVGWVKALSEGVELDSRNAEALAEDKIKYDESTGAISKNAAVRMLAALHTAQYTAQLSDLKTRLSEISGASYYTPAEKLEKTAQTNNQIKALTGANDKQSLKDSEGIYSTITTASHGFHQFFDQFNQDAANSAATVHQALSTSINGVNNELVKVMTGQKTHFGQVFKSTGEGLMSAGLKRFESSLFGGKLGTRANPMITQDVNNSTSAVKSALGGLGGKIGGYLSSFAGFLHIPGFAEGGNPNPYGTSIVGERGPELFVPRGVAGTIIPNKSLKGMGGSSPTIVNHIDARGTNPAEVDMRVRQGSAAAYAQAMQDAPRAQQERARRRPSSFRG